jgi:uncharacterized membrane protein YkvA (DUF1232 family)
MQYSHLFKILETSGLSPEQFAPYLGISGMTLRRWREKPGDEEIPKLYERSLEAAVSQLIREGRLDPESPLARQTLKDSLESFQSVLTNLGFSEDILSQSKNQEETVVLGLSQIGADEEKRHEVERSHKKILDFKKFSKEWGRRISTLMSVVTSKQIKSYEKLVAYGALFYLINPFDLIPDHIPGFGFVDDYAILGMASVYYLTRFAKLFK